MWDMRLKNGHGFKTTTKFSQEIFIRSVVTQYRKPIGNKASRAKTNPGLSQHQDTQLGKHLLLKKLSKKIPD